MSSNYPNNLPEKFNPSEYEAKWQQDWENTGVYNWDENRSREDTFIVDTPPPTVSGSLHVGHVFSYTQTDLIVRYQRMTGKNIFYPMGWDDNGLPTERRVQNVYKIQCDLNHPYDIKVKLDEWQIYRPSEIDVFAGLYSEVSILSIR